MIYTLIISLLIGKPFYLLRLQSFSFQIVSEFIDIFVKFFNCMSQGWGFDSLFCPGRRVFVHNDCPGGVYLLPSSRVPRACPGGMILGEIDTCISKCRKYDSIVRRYPNNIFKMKKSTSAKSPGTCTF